MRVATETVTIPICIAQVPGYSEFRFNLPESIGERAGPVTIRIPVGQLDVAGEPETLVVYVDYERKIVTRIST